MSPKQTRLAAAIARCITANLRDPTHEMRVAFERLSTSHKVVLFALIDVDTISITNQRHDLMSLAAKLASPTDESDVERLLHDLSEGFLRINRLKMGKQTYQQIQWIHPSCRDLAIEQLGRSRQFRQRFLKHCSISGVEVAISIGGGASGRRVLPLLQHSEDWRQLVQRCVELVPENPELLSTFASTIQLLRREDPQQPSLGPLADAAAATLHAYASGREYWQARDLEPFLELRRMLQVTQPVPGLRSFFEDEFSLAEILEDETTSITEYASSLSRFARVCFVLAQNAPDEAKFIFDSQPFKRFALALEQRAESEIDSHYIRGDWSADDLTSESEHYVELADACRTFSTIQVSNMRPLEILADYAWRFESEAESLVEEAARKNPEPDYEPDDDSDSKSISDPPGENLQRIFDDL